MKKFFAIAAVVAVALTSCVKNEVISPAGKITFKDFTLSNKALVLPGSTAEEALLPGHDFGAYALYTGTYEGVDDVTDAVPNEIYINGLKVSHNGTDWAYETPQYWPTNVADELDFYAYYPYNETVASWDAVNNCVKLTAANLTTTLGNQTDWMVTTPVIGKTKDNASSGVGIVFNHITSMLLFNAIDVTADTRYQNLVSIKKIEVKNAAYTGTYTNGAWTALDNRVDVTVMNGSKDVTTTIAPVTTTEASGGALIVVPETMGDDVIFTVTYDVAESADHVVEKRIGATADIKVKDLTATWEAGKKYSYTIKFDLIGGTEDTLEEITFTPTVAPWTEKTAETTI